MFFKKKKEQEQGISGVNIRVVIKRIAGKVPVVVAEFNAIQQRDKNYNMVLVNEDKNFKEEMDITKQPVIEFLHYKLESSNKKRDEKLKEIDAKIDFLSKKLKRVENGKLSITKKVKNDAGKEVEKTEEVEVNRIDLENELMNYKVLRFHIDNEGEGSYETINSEGNRQMEFCIIDGVLYPYFHRTNVDKGEKLTMYPDIAAKRKFYKEEDDRILNDYLEANKEGIFAGIKGIIMVLAIVALFISGVILHVRVNARAAEIDETIESQVARYRRIANDATTTCAHYYYKLVEDEIINKSLEIPEEEEQEREGITGIVDISERIMGET